jgi:hypothetical protein
LEAIGRHVNDNDICIEGADDDLETSATKYCECWATKDRHITSGSGGHNNDQSNNLQIVPD